MLKALCGYFSISQIFHDHFPRSLSVKGARCWGLSLQALVLRKGQLGCQKNAGQWELEQTFSGMAALLSCSCGVSLCCFCRRDGSFVDPLNETKKEPSS